ncbi:MAG TPA: class I SAM-dependent methyltransferase [Ktedonobacterales bacterium]
MSLEEVDLERGDRAYSEANRVIWNQWLTRDTDSDHFKDVARYRATGSSLRPIEREALGDVADKSLLHLQCNMGSETLSWARLGARVVGVDIADCAVDAARALAEEGALTSRATFVRSDINDLPGQLNEQFDIVIATYGALCWAPDIERWARVAARYVAPGGTLLLVDLHPAGMALNTEPDDPRGLRLQLSHSYFHTLEPLTAERPDEPPVYAWTYGLGEVVSAVAAAGLRVESLREYPLAHWRQFSQLVESGDGYWRWPDSENTLPLLFALLARG